MNEHKYNLTTPISPQVQNNQQQPTGVPLILLINDVAHQSFHDDKLERASRFEKMLNAEMDWVESFVNHSPTIGNHYENVLRDLLREYLPSSIKVGTGFVYDSLSRTCSPQIDILTYTDTEQSPIYRRGEFVIVDTLSTKSVCEVKKSLSPKELRFCIRKTLNHKLGGAAKTPNNIQQLSIFTFNCQTKTTKLAEIVAEEIQQFLESFRHTTIAGETVYMLAFHMTLPHIYFANRNESITVSVTQDTSNPIFGRISIEILKNFSNGVSQFLGSMHQQVNDDPSYRDFVSNYLSSKIENEIQIECPFIPVRKMHSAEMLQRYPDAHEILSKSGPHGERIYAAIFSSFVNPSKYPTLKLLSQTPGFRWEC